MNDLISRQAALNALGDEPEVWTGKDEYAMGLNNQWHYDRNAILSCPSAQPLDVQLAYLKGVNDGIEQYIERIKRIDDEIRRRNEGAIE